MAEYDYTIDYNEQMLNYYPEVIKAIREFQALIKVQSVQVEDIHNELVKMLENAYISTADAATIEKWEKFLNITPLSQGDDDYETWINDRRATILARLYTVEKLNTDSISNIVSIFTGGTAKSYFKDGTIHVLIEPPKGSNLYKFDNVVQEIGKKIPAHLAFEVKRNYQTWGEINDKHLNWFAVRSNYADWNSVLYNIPKE